MAAQFGADKSQRTLKRHQRICRKTLVSGRFDKVGLHRADLSVLHMASQYAASLLYTSKTKGKKVTSYQSFSVHVTYKSSICLTNICHVIVAVIYLSASILLSGS